MEELRKEFEKTNLFKAVNKCIGGVNYRDKGGYFIDDKPYFYLNGDFAMFQELRK